MPVILFSRLSCYYVKYVSNFKQNWTYLKQASEVESNLVNSYEVTMNL